jgi:DNA-binding GntR family transcriptional regulator
VSHPPSSPVEAGLESYAFPGASRGHTPTAVTDVLREAILDGALRPGEWLREGDLARILSVSRTPVREALSRLVEEGLAAKTAHQGVVVATLTFDDVLALYAVREQLEGLAARLAATRGGPQLVHDLELVGERMAQAATDGDVPLLARLNLEWHRLVRDAARNTYLNRFLSQVEHAIRRLSVSTFADEQRALEVLAEHDHVVRAIAAGNGDVAEQEAKAHMRRAREARLAHLMRDS